MKGLSTTLLIVITAVVILVAALVLLTIFGTVVQNIGTISQAQSMCTNEASLTCPTSWPPATWNVPTKKLPDKPAMSCSTLVTCICTNGQFGGCTNNNIG